MTLERQKGTFGEVDVYYRTLAPTETHPYVPPTVTRAGESDFRQSLAVVRFQGSDTMKTITVTVLDDVEPENDESFYVILVNATLYAGAQGRTGKIFTLY